MVSVILNIILKHLIKWSLLEHTALSKMALSNPYPESSGNSTGEKAVKVKERKEKEKTMRIRPSKTTEQSSYEITH